VAVAGTLGMSFGNAAKITSGRVNPTAKAIESKDKNLKERYRGCFIFPSCRVVLALPVDGLVPPVGRASAVSVSKSRGWIVPLVEAYKGRVLDEVKMNAVVTVKDQHDGQHVVEYGMF
jgi:hypothetical protein